MTNIQQTEDVMLSAKKLCNSQIFKQLNAMPLLGDYVEYTVNDEIFGTLDEKIKKNVVETLNKHFYKIQEWHQQCGFIYTGEDTVLETQLPYLILSLSESQAKIDKVRLVSLFDELIWNHEEKQLQRIGSQAIIGVVCYNKKHNARMLKFMQQCSTSRNFNPLLCNEFEIRLQKMCSVQDLEQRSWLFRVQQMLFLLVQYSLEGIRNQYQLTQSQYVDNAVLELETPCKISIDGFESTIQRIVGDKPLPLLDHQKHEIGLDVFFGVCRQLPTQALTKRAYQLLLLIIFYGVGVKAENKSLFDDNQEPDLSMLEEYLKGLLYKSENKPISRVCGRYGVNMEIAVTGPFGNDKSLWKSKLAKFYELLNQLSEDLTPVFHDGRTAKHFSYILCCRAMLQAVYLPQARHFSKLVLGMCGFLTTVVRFEDELEQYIQILFNELGISHDTQPNLSIGKMVELLAMNNNPMLNTQSLKTILDDILKESDNNGVLSSKSLVTALLFDAIDDNSNDKEMKINHVKLDTYEREQIFKNNHKLGGNYHALFIAAPVYKAGHIQSLLKYLDKVANHNPFFIWQTPVAIDYFDTQILKEMSCQIQGQSNGYLFIPEQVKLAGSLQEQLFEYYQIEQLTNIDLDKQKVLEDFIYLDKQNKQHDERYIATIYNYQPIKTDGVFQHIVKNYKKIIRNLSGAMNEIVGGIAGVGGMSELEKLALMGDDAAFFNQLKDDEKHLYIYKKQIDRLLTTLEKEDQVLKTLSQYCHAMLLGAIPILVVTCNSPLRERLKLPYHNLPKSYFEGGKQVAVLIPSQLPLLQTIGTPIIWDMFTSGSSEFCVVNNDYLDNIIDKTDGELDVKTAYVQAKPLDEIWEHQTSEPLRSSLNYLTKEDFMELFGGFFDGFMDLKEKTMVLPVSEFNNLGQPLVNGTL